MNKKRRFIAIILAGILSILAIDRGYSLLKDKFLYELVIKRLQTYFYRKYGATLFIGNLRGNLFTNLYLDNIQLNHIKGFPEELQAGIKNAEFSYNPLDLFRRSPKLELSGLELTYKDLRLPVKFYQNAGLIILSFNKSIFDLHGLEGFFIDKGCLALYGLGSLKGGMVLENLKPKFFEVEFESDNLEIFYTERLKAEAILKLNLQGTSNITYLDGSVVVKEARYLGEIDRTMSENSLLSFGNSLFLDIDIKGENIQIRNNSLDAIVRADLRLKKEFQDKPYLLGKIESVKGTYLVYQNKFNLKKAGIIFNGNSGREARIDILGQTKVRRYQISAAVKGTISNSHLEITSKPQLPRDEIMALLLFGKRIDGLTISEKNELSGLGDMTDSFISKIFLGKAEAKAAKIIGVDELTIGTDITSKSQGSQMPSVEVGKYLAQDKLYGTYKVTPGQNSGQKSEKTMSGEYNITEHITVKGERSFSESINLPQEDRVSIDFRWKF